MSKFLKIIIVLTLAFLLSACENTQNSTTSKPITSYKKADLENIKKIKEQKIEENLHKEFVSLFNDFSGFDFEKYFFIPQEGKYSSWEVEEASETEAASFNLVSSYIFTQTKAEELLEILRNNYYFKAYYDRSDMLNYDFHSTKKFHLDTGRENRLECYFFKREGLYIDTYVFRYISIEVLPTDATNNAYSVFLRTTIEREPPPGESWPQYLTNHPRTFLNKSGTIIDPSATN